ncbi:chorismate mutase [Nesterenkonia sp. NBAIMH1]|uniref:chorismate mutase n=1 Tax=Nesterenkonia sp. NBAIMH1 TaxID=2600320 RepID=UPI0011B4C0B5|nr:chorismate mutase [Nesterenkonia sp. NBAIMH1]
MSTQQPSYDRAGEAGKYVDPEILQELLSMRSSIDNIDAALIHMLAERFKATQRVGRLKARHKLPPSDPQREKNQIARLKQLAANAELDPDFAEKFLNFIIEEVIRHHQALSATESDGHPPNRPAAPQDPDAPFDWATES